MSSTAGKKSHSTTRKGPAPWVFLIAIVPAALLCIVVMLQPFVEPTDLFRDPLRVAHEAAGRGECCHAYYGFVSQLGGLLWAGGTFIGLFAATVLFVRGAANGAWQFMAAAGVLTGLLAVDDVFQGHEFVYPTLFGVTEGAVVGIYGLLIAAFLWVFRRHILDVGPALLVIALSAFGIGVAADLFVSEEAAWHRIAEEGGKFVGISAWTAFLWWAAWAKIRNMLTT